ncbi:MAG: DUF2127 domain-containing protein [Acidobacteria bacterium]|nr:DUF2127 domain-containing protein [Acidobacteriota bacterium]
MHPYVHDPAHIKGLRTVATVEFTKGVIVVLAGLGLFSMRHRDIWGIAESFLEFFHANPYHHYVGVFIDLVYRISDMHLWKIATVASVYVILRFIEAYGLWYALPWAEWLAFASGTIYIPFELVDLLHRPTWFRLLVLTVNLVIVLYMLYLRLDALEKRRIARAQQTAG